MRITTTALAAYETPEANIIGIDIQSLVCTSTEGYSLNPDGLDEDDFE